MRALVVLLALAACDGQIRSTKAPRGSIPTADEVVARMKQTYATARTYQDHGTATLREHGSSPVVTTFSTTFVRSTGFRFEVRDASGTFTAWLADGTPYTSTAPREAYREASIGDALAAGGIPSNGASLLAPALLFEQTPLLAQMGPLTLVAAPVDVGGHPCWRLIGGERGWTFDVMVDRDRHVLRRIVQSHAADGGGPDLESVIEIEPGLGAAVSADELRGPALATLDVQDRPHATWIGVLFEAQSTVVRDVLPKSPAAAAGVQPGDTLVSVAGTGVKVPAEVIDVVQAHRAGETVDVVYTRGGVQAHAAITIANRPDLVALQQTKLVDQKAPAFVLPTLAGGSFDLASTRGKVVIVDFWASWCGPCRSTLPTLRRWHEELGARGLAIVGVTDDEVEAVKQSVAEFGLPYPIALDGDHAAWRDYLVQGLPTTVVIDKQGVIRYLGVGAGDEATLEQLVRTLLK